MKIEQLNEGLRFGQKDRRSVDLEARDVIIGVEYEFNWNEHEDTIADMDEIFDGVVEHIKKIIEQDIEIKKYDYINHSSFQIDNNVESLTTIMGDIKTIMEGIDIGDEMFDVSDEVEIARIISDDEQEDDVPTDEQMSSYNTFKAKAKAYQDFFNKWQFKITDASSLNAENDTNYTFSSYADHELFLVIEDLEDLEDHIIELAKIDFDDFDDVSVMNSTIFDTLYTYVQSFINVTGDASSWYDLMIEQIEQFLADDFDQLLEDDPENVLGYDPENVQDHPDYDQFADDTLEQVPEGSADLIRSEMEQSFILFDEIEDVVADTSVPEGGEVVTKPLPMKRAFDVMEEMFEFIEEHGSTGDNTGMHVNISIKGLRFAEDNFNKLKMALLADPEYFQSHDKFPPRSHVNRQFGGITSEELVKLAQTYNESGWDKLLLELEKNLRLNYKSQAINFGNDADADINLRRIEFRFFGGDGYEKKLDELIDDIYKTVFVMMASYSPTFGNNEYIKAVVKLLDKLVQKHVKTDVTTFIGLAQELKGNKKLTNSSKFLDDEQYASLFARIR